MAFANPVTNNVQYANNVQCAIHKQCAIRWPSFKCVVRICLITFVTEVLSLVANIGCSHITLVFLAGVHGVLCY